MNAARFLLLIGRGEGHPPLVWSLDRIVTDAITHVLTLPFTASDGEPLSHGQEHLPALPLPAPLSAAPMHVAAASVTPVPPPARRDLAAQNAVAPLGKRLPSLIQPCYDLAMRTKDTLDGQSRPTFTEVARRAQIIEVATETIATLGYAQASLAQIATRAGISKGVITYYFASKEQLIGQVVEGMYKEAVAFMGPQIAAETTAAARLRAYLRSNIAYIAAHRLQMTAVIDIVRNARTEDGRLRYHPGKEEADLAALEAMLRQGQDEGAFLAFDRRVMAVTIRGAIDGTARFILANPTTEADSYAQELVTLFDRATRQD